MSLHYVFFIGMGSDMRRKLIIAGIPLVLFCAVIFAGSWVPLKAFRASLVRVLIPVMRFAGATGWRIASFRDTASREEPEICERHEQARAVAEAKLTEALAATASLERALGLKQRLGHSVKSARVTLYARYAQGEMLVIDAGDEDLVRAGDQVVDEEGFLVGDITETGPGFSKVTIASNAGVAFPVTLAPSGLSGEALARGIGARAFLVELIPEDALFHAGDFVKRVSKDARSREAIFAARLTDEGSASGGAFKKAHAVLLAHPERLEGVFVIPGL